MANKLITTRIKNKVDFLSAWRSSPVNEIDSTTRLLDGEIAVVRVPTGESYVNPVTNKSEPVVELLMKVGDGTSTFDQLPWMSAKASDVYNWAKVQDPSVIKVKYLNGTTYVEATLADILKDLNTAESDISTIKANISSLQDKLRSGIRFIGIVAEEPEGASITIIEGEDSTKTVDANVGDIVIWAEQGKEYIYDGSIWEELGDVTRISDLETKVDTLSAEDISYGNSTVEGALDDRYTKTEVYTKAEVNAEFAKHAGLGHTHGNITNDGKLTVANRVVITDTDQKITVSSITTDKLGYLTDVTSNIQAQLNAKAASGHIHSGYESRLANIEGTFAKYNSTDKQLYIGEDVIIFDCGGAEFGMTNTPSNTPITGYTCSNCGEAYASLADANNCIKEPTCPGNSSSPSEDVYYCPNCESGYATESEANNCINDPGCPGNNIYSYPCTCATCHGECGNMAMEGGSLCRECQEAGHSLSGYNCPVCLEEYDSEAAANNCTNDPGCPGNKYHCTNCGAAYDSEADAANCTNEGHCPGNILSGHWCYGCNDEWVEAGDYCGKCINMYHCTNCGWAYETEAAANSCRNEGSCPGHNEYPCPSCGEAYASEADANNCTKYQDCPGNIGTCSYCGWQLNEGGSCSNPDCSSKS